MARVAWAQSTPFTISYPEIAAYGIESSGVDNVREVHIAAANGTAMVAFIKDGYEIGFAYFDGTNWLEGDITQVEPTEDPTVVYGMTPSGPTYICCYKTGDSVQVERFDSATNSFGSQVSVRSTGGVGVDKPWMVANIGDPV